MNSAAEKPKLEPKLRFPEFREAEGWTTETLGSVASISTEKVGDNVCIPMSITSGIGLVSQMEKFGRIIAGNSYTNYLVLRKNDFAYNKSATKEYPEGFIALYSGDELAAVPNSIFTCFRIKGDSLIPQYLNYLLLSNLHGQWLRKFIEVGARAHGSLSINEDDLLALPVPLPSGKTSPSEQHRIASCLSSLDDLIGGESQKLDALKAHKKGLMQQLFPRDGETRPRLRFPEFWDGPEWLNEPLSELGDIVTGKTPSTKDPRLWGGSILFITPTDISEDFKYQYKTQRTVVETESTKVLPGGSVVYTCIASIGKMALTVCPSITNQQINAVVSNNRTNGEFTYYALANITPWIKSIPASSTLAIINKTEFSKICVAIPEDKAEQNAVVVCLSSIDDLITAQSDKLEALKIHKKGLIQQLFPSQEEAE
jgi:type I restriction enzyme, S subunit